MKHPNTLILKILNEYPDCRDDDTKLYIKFIEISENRTLPAEFVDLIYKYHHAHIVRERAFIQNTCHLCEASDKIRIKRNKRGHKIRKLFGLFNFWN